MTEILLIVTKIALLTFDYIVGSTIYIDGGMTPYPGFETGG